MQSGNFPVDFLCMHASEEDTPVPPPSVYPVKYQWTRYCEECKKLVKVNTTVFEPGKVSHRGECGHCWDIKGQLLKKWLDGDRKFTLN